MRQEKWWDTEQLARGCCDVNRYQASWLSGVTTRTPDERLFIAPADQPL
jgi:hypothetical protein